MLNFHLKKWEFMRIWWVDLPRLFPSPSIFLLKGLFAANVSRYGPTYSGIRPAGRDFGSVDRPEFALIMDLRPVAFLTFSGFHTTYPDTAIFAR
jgi:hypothetical protein